MRTTTNKARQTGDIEPQGLGVDASVSYWKWLQENAPDIYYAEIEAQQAGNKFEKLKDKVSTLKIGLQQKFYVWFFRKMKQIAAQDSSVFYEVLASSSPNPLSSEAIITASGAGAIAIRGFRMLLVPLQKLMQYYVWKLSPEGSVAKQNPPQFTRQDMFYMGLDITLLGLTAAAFFAGAPIPAAAIAATIATISAGVAVYQYGKYLYEGYQLKQERRRVDTIIQQFDNDPHKNLTMEQVQIIMEQRQKMALEQPDKNFTDYELLCIASRSLTQKIKASIDNRYQKMRQTLGVGLTMLTIVGVSLVLGGLMLGPYGAPVIMAGVVCGAVAGGIAIGMMVVNAVKKAREEKQATIGKKSLENDTVESTNQYRAAKQLGPLYGQQSTATTTLSSSQDNKSTTQLSWSLQSRINASKKPVNDDEFQDKHTEKNQPK